MSRQPDRDQRIPTFVDEVDSVVEFTDVGEASPSSPGAVQSQERRHAILTDVVDRVAEFMDSPANLEAAGASGERRPLFIDTVDNLVEFVDQPTNGAALESQVPSDGRAEAG